MHPSSKCDESNWVVHIMRCLIYHKNFSCTAFLENCVKQFMRMNSNRFEFLSNYLAEQNCFDCNFCIENPNQLVLVAKFMINLPLAAIKISDHLEQVGFWIFFEFVVLIVVVFAFSLGFDICGNPESDPPQQLEQQQQGKQFDHIPLYPII